MTSRARRGLEAFLKRKAAPLRESRGLLALPDGTDLPLLVRRHPTARRLTLRLVPDGSEARVTIPRWAPFDEGRSFAASRRDWLMAQRLNLPHRTAIGPGSFIAYRGSELLVSWHENLPRRPAIVGRELHLGGTPEALERRIQRWLENEALAHARSDLGDFCAAAGRSVPDMRLSRARRRWGSCTSDGTIRINWRLIMAPDFVRRSVVAHEVAHLVHFDHSRDFHALLAQIYDGDIAAADRWLKREGRTLHAAFG